MDITKIITDINLLEACKWSGIVTIALATITGIAFVLNWGFRFRLVGVSSFMAVITAGLFGLGLGLSVRIEIPGAARYTLVYDTGATQTVIAVAPKITKSELSATLEQAAGDLFSYGRIIGPDAKLTIRARTVIHPKPGVSEPLYLGEVKRRLSQRVDPEMSIEIFDKNLDRAQNS